MSLKPFILRNRDTLVRAGVRQGCPLSPLLFIMAMEPLACALRQNKLIKGIIPPGNYGKDVKLTMYMDDLTLLVVDNSSIKESLKICERFTVASGMKINKTKSEIMYRNWNDIKINWGLIEQSDSIKVLGVYVGENMKIDNWKAKLPKIQGKLLQWKDRELSLIGKVLVIKTEIISTLAYLASTFPLPHKIMASLRKMMFRFLWGSQHEKLKRDIMYRPLSEGGRNVPNIQIKFKAMFLTPILRVCLNVCPEPIWAPYVKFWLGGRVLKTWKKRVTLHSPFSDKLINIL
uniref:Reverse transcriptase domain-containing protein n=1 Tax=Poecilia reticulata TaxID=8081 RepID=A0A3P9NBN4_POERE